MSIGRADRPEGLLLRPPQPLTGWHLREHQRATRQYLPEGADLSVYSQAELDGIADRLNTRPRATHDWHTPLEVFTQTLASSHKSSSPVL